MTELETLLLSIRENGVPLEASVDMLEPEQLNQIYAGLQGKRIEDRNIAFGAWRQVELALCNSTETSEARVTRVSNAKKLFEAITGQPGANTITSEPLRFGRFALAFMPLYDAMAARRYRLTAGELHSVYSNMSRILADADAAVEHGPENQREQNYGALCEGIGFALPIRAALAARNAEQPRRSSILLPASERQRATKGRDGVVPLIAGQDIGIEIKFRKGDGPNVLRIGRLLFEIQDDSGEQHRRVPLALARAATLTVARLITNEIDTTSLIGGTSAEAFGLLDQAQTAIDERLNRIVGRDPEYDLHEFTRF